MRHNRKDFILEEINPSLGQMVRVEFSKLPFFMYSSPVSWPIIFGIMLWKVARLSRRDLTSAKHYSSLKLSELLEVAYFRVKSGFTELPQMMLESNEIKTLHEQFLLDRIKIQLNATVTRYFEEKSRLSMSSTDSRAVLRVMRDLCKGKLTNPGTLPSYLQVRFVGRTVNSWNGMSHQLKIIEKYLQNSKNCGKRLYNLLHEFVEHLAGYAFTDQLKNEYDQHHSASHQQVTQEIERVLPVTAMQEIVREYVSTTLVKQSPKTQYETLLTQSQVFALTQRVASHRLIRPFAAFAELSESEVLQVKFTLACEVGYRDKAKELFKQFNQGEGVLRVMQNLLIGEMSSARRSLALTTFLSAVSVNYFQEPVVGGNKLLDHLIEQNDRVNIVGLIKKVIQAGYQNIESFVAHPSNLAQLPQALLANLKKMFLINGSLSGEIKERDVKSVSFFIKISYVRKQFENALEFYVKHGYFDEGAQPAFECKV